MASMATMTRYHLSDFESKINSGFKCELPSEILDIIQKLADQVGAPEYIKTPQFVRKEGHNNGYRNRNRRRKQKATELSDEAWNEIRNFEATKRVEREGIDKSIDNVRKAMNKISNKTYDTLKETIFTELKTIVDSGIDTDGEDMNKLVDSLYRIASQNGFYSELYAKLYAELVENYDFIKAPLEKSVAGFITGLNTIKYVSPDEDYDQFCKNNKDNTVRRAVGGFFVNALKHGLIDAESIIEIVDEIQEKITNYMDSEGQTEIIDELSELVGEIVPSILTVLDKAQHEEAMRNMIQNIRQVSKLSAKKYPSLSNKAVFKHMDILECDEVESAIQSLA